MNIIHHIVLPLLFSIFRRFYSSFPRPKYMPNSRSLLAFFSSYFFHLISTGIKLLQPDLRFLPLATAASDPSCSSLLVQCQNQTSSSGMLGATCVPLHLVLFCIRSFVRVLSAVAIRCHSLCRCRDSSYSTISQSFSVKSSKSIPSSAVWSTPPKQWRACWCRRQCTRHLCRLLRGGR